MRKLARQIAISDIHGCAKTFRKLLHDKVAINREDTLYLLGDYINKGPDACGVIDEIFSLKNAGIEVHCLRGNHEQYLIDALDDSGNEFDFLIRGGMETLESYGITSVFDLPYKHVVFLRSLDFYKELDDYFLVHAGFNFDLPDPFSDKNSMLTLKKMTVDKSRIKHKTILHGHVPTPLNKIKQDITGNPDHISIDAGCVYPYNPELYHLVAMDIDTRKLYIQENID